MGVLVVFGLAEAVRRPSSVETEKEDMTLGGLTDRKRGVVVAVVVEEEAAKVVCFPRLGRCTTISGTSVSVGAGKWLARKISLRRSALQRIFSKTDLGETAGANGRGGKGETDGDGGLVRVSPL